MQTFGASGENSILAGGYDRRDITATSNAYYFGWLEWQADHSMDNPRISLEEGRPDIANLYGNVLATMWCNDFEKFLTQLEEIRDGGSEDQSINGGQ